MQIIKRNGDKVEYDGEKIIIAIKKAMEDADKRLNDVAHHIEFNIRELINASDEDWSVEDVSDEIENQLMDSGLHKVAKEYILYRERKKKERKHKVSYTYLNDKFINKYKNLKPPMTELGALVYYRTYSRFLPEFGRREYWYETVARVVDYNVGLAKWTSKNQAITEAELMYDNVFNLKQFPSGRTLWSGGTQTSYERPISQFNCFSGDTEFLTKDGIKTFDSFKDGEKTIVLNGNGGWSESTVKQFGKQNTVKLHLHRSGSREKKVVRTTNDHLWFKLKSDTHYEKVPTSALTKGDKLKSKRANDRTKIDICEIGVQHGIVYGDGHIEKNRGYSLVKLIGKKKDLVKYFHNKPTWYDESTDGILVRQLPSTWKTLPSIDMNPQYLKGFVTGLLLTDGDLDSSIKLCQKSLIEMKKIRSIFEVLGITTSEIKENIRVNSNFGEYDNPHSFVIHKETVADDMLEVLSVSSKRNPMWIVDAVEQTGEVENVYCVVEPKTHSFTLTGGLHTHNCAYAVFDNFDIVYDIAYLLMLGVGFGFSVERDYVEKLPKVRSDIKIVHLDYDSVPKRARKEATEYNISGDVMELIVGDSKAGWSKSIDLLTKVFYHIDFKHVKTLMVNYNHVRPFGEPLKTFGGRASGHDALKTILTKLTKVFLKGNQGFKTLKPVDAMDIATIIAEGIVVGGTRRSAEMCLSTDGDEEMMNAKMNLYYQDEETGTWVANQEILHRMMSNNSTMYWKKPSYEDLKSRFEIIKHSAENNFFNGEQAKKRFPEFKGTNPCLRGDMKILTSDGYVEIKELEGKNTTLINKDGVKSTGKVWCSGEKEVFEIKFLNKELDSLFATKDHKFMTNDGLECEVKDLRNKRLMPYLETSSNFSKKFVKYGFIQGDGNLGRLSSDIHKGIEVNIGANDSDVASLFNVKHSKNYSHYLTGYNEDLKRLGFCDSKTFNRVFPSTFENWNEFEKISFIKGVYSANGSVINVGRISYKTASLQFANELKTYLESVGYKPYITTNKPKNVNFNNGNYVCKESYDVNLCKYVDLKRFYEEIGFVQKYKMNKLKLKLIEKSPTIASVKSTNSIEPVYDFTEPITHWGVINGYVTHNCGEILLDSHEFCNLVTLVIPNFIKNGKLDKNELLNAQRLNSRIAYRVTIPTLELPKWDATQKRDRLLGLSMTGWQDAMNIVGYSKEEQSRLLRELKQVAWEEMERYANSLGLSHSKLITTVKPEGCWTKEFTRTLDTGIYFIDEIDEDIFNKEVGFYDVSAQNLSYKGNKVSKSYVNERKELIKITLKNGRVLKVTPKHPLMVNGRWVEARNLEEDDIIDYDLGGYNNTLNTPLNTELDLSDHRSDVIDYTLPHNMSEDLAYLFGAYFANGSFTTHHRIKFISNHYDVHKKIQKLWKDLFNVDTTIVKCKNKEAYTQEFRSTKIRLFFELNGLNKYDENGEMNKIPLAIRTSSKDTILSFIVGYADNDGHFHSKSMCIDSANEKFMRHLQEVGEAVGISFGISVNTQRSNSYSKKPMYKLHLSRAFTARYAIDYINLNSIKGEYQGKIEYATVRSKNPYSVTQVEVIESSETYDIEVENIHMYSQGGLISHNTLSQLPTVSSGVHMSHSPYYVRRIRMNSEDPLVKVCEELGYPIYPEVGQTEENCTTKVIEFPVKAPDGNTKYNVSAIEQLEVYKMFMENYVDHNASNTISVRPDEWDEVVDWVYNNWDTVVGITFISLDDSFYQLLPYEKISEDEYSKRRSNMKDFNPDLLLKYEVGESSDDDLVDDDCVGGACPVR